MQWRELGGLVTTKLLPSFAIFMRLRQKIFYAFNGGWHWVGWNLWSVCGNQLHSLLRRTFIYPTEDAAHYCWLTVLNCLRSSLQCYSSCWSLDFRRSWLGRFQNTRTSLIACLDHHNFDFGIYQLGLTAAQTACFILILIYQFWI